MPVNQEDIFAYIVGAVIIVLVILMLTISGCSTLLDSKDQTLLVKVTSEGCEKLDVTGSRGVITQKSVTEKGINLKLK